MRNLKIVMMGAGGVGKTSMTNQFVKETFDERYEPTIEDTYNKTFSLDGESYALELVDTAGMEQFTQMRDLYIKKSDGFILVYSIIDPTTFEDIKAIREQIVRNKCSEQVPIVLVGNKLDLADEERAIPTDDGKTLAEKWPHCHFVETTAREHGDVENVFVYVIREIVSFEKMRRNRVNALHKEATRKKKSGKCLVM